MDVVLHEEEGHAEEELEEEEPEEEDPEEWENEEEPEVQANAWLNDHGMAEQVQVEIEAIPEEEPEPESDVEELWEHLLTEETPPAPPCKHVDVGYLFDMPLIGFPYFPVETLEELPLQTEAEIQEQLRRQEEYELEQAEKAHKEALRIYFGLRRQ
ncbi:hypothetical protein RHGRI_011192 [Rhododendron griersonianum]|uniref:Uncharacterized protein n=1 Tax=Rhododendron griersonianum TaxID=479676 RepID=A0AAV6KM67_9ERIC|nr:hypothetical protein RHGRI_011192 [Rhododendron griersonianum]